MLSIGDIARRAGVKVPTIRYYEQAGLLAPAERSEGNQRRYGRADLERLSFIRHARELGFPLDAIRQLIALDASPDAESHEAERIARAQLAVTRGRIERLRKLERELAPIAAACEGGSHMHCRVIEALADHDACAAEHEIEPAAAVPEAPRAARRRAG